jgi:hypothetical protein
VSYLIHVVCRDPSPMSRAAIAECIADGAFFDAPRFEPDPGSPEAASPDWGHLVLYVEPGAPPLVIRSCRGDAARKSARLVGFVFEEREVPLPEPFASLALDPGQVFEIEIARGSGLSEDTWAMLTVLEAFLARERDGFVFSGEDGIYDRDVQLLVPLRA